MPEALHSSRYRQRSAACHCMYPLQRFACAKGESCVGIQSLCRHKSLSYHFHDVEGLSDKDLTRNVSHRVVAVSMFIRTWAIPPAVPAARSLTAFDIYTWLFLSKNWPASSFEGWNLWHELQIAELSEKRILTRLRLVTLSSRQTLWYVEMHRNKSVQSH